MDHFPIFLSLTGRRVIVSGGAEAALAKLRLLLKTSAKITVFAPDPDPQIIAWARQGTLTHISRAVAPGDAAGAALTYAADEDSAADARTARIAMNDGSLVNIVDNLADSQFITPAIVDRDPVTIAIGTEGAAPVLARIIKADLEGRLPASIGTLARIGKGFRAVAEALPFGRARRDFWRDYYLRTGPKAMTRGPAAVEEALQTGLTAHLMRKSRPAHVYFVGAGPGDPDLLTLKARKLLDEADVVIHDPLVTPEILDLARREARMITPSQDGACRVLPHSGISALIARHTRNGAQVVRLISGDPTGTERLNAEIRACDAHALSYTIVPGISATHIDIGTLPTRPQTDLAYA